MGQPGTTVTGYQENPMELLEKTAWIPTLILIGMMPPVTSQGLMSANCNIKT